MQKANLGMLLSAAIAAVATAVPAAAGDWTQAYIGIGLGADAITGEAGASDTTTGIVSGEGVGGGDLGLSLRVGADYQFSGNFVAGLVGIYDWSNIETIGRASDGTDSASINLAKLDRSLTIAARGGFLLTPALLAYGLAGYTRVTFDDITYSSPDESGRISLSSYDSFVFGGGFEYRIAPNWSLFGEYRRADLDRRNILTLSEGADQVNVWTDPVMHWARIGAAYRFGAVSEASAEAPAAAKWTGLYGGVGIGLDAATRDLAVLETGCAPTCQSIALEGLGGGGFGATLSAGYDYRFNNVVAGAFADFDWSDHDITLRASARGETVSATLLGLDKSWTFGARLGFLAAEDVLVYGLLGYTHATFDDASVSGGGQTLSFDMPSFDGITAGGGFEKLLTPNVSLRLEYRYVDLGEEVVKNANLEDTRITLDPSMHMARAMLGYRF